MNMKWITFGLVGLMATAGFAQDAVSPFYLKGTVVNTQGQLRSYAGGKSTGFALELGHDFHKPQDSIGISIFAAYQRVNGDENTNEVVIDWDGNTAPLNTAFGLDTWRFGADLRFSTPVKGLVPFAGINVNFHDGYWKGISPVLGKAGDFPDTKAKFGFRVGVEYFVTSRWSVAAEYNATEWRSDASEYVDPVTQTTVRKGKGYNPVHPSWVGLSVGYRFGWKF